MKLLQHLQIKLDILQGYAPITHYKHGWNDDNKLGYCYDGGNFKKTVAVKNSRLIGETIDVDNILLDDQHYTKLTRTTYYTHAQLNDGRDCILFCRLISKDSPLDNHHNIEYVYITHENYYE